MKKFFRIFGLVFSVAILGSAIYGIVNARSIMDWAALRSYDPPSRVVELADSTTMDDSTRNIFYVNHPAIQTKSEFANACTQQEETIVLGCYVQNNGIYLLDVNDPRLQGIVEVTAAHETLHALYDRLDNSERQRVDKMTADYFANLKDERIRENIENYRKRDPSVVPNELHSILGTEVRDLSPELEAYYSQYFTNRKAIVAFSEKYEQTFINIENQVKTYQSQLEVMKTALDENEKQLDELGLSVDNERKRLDSLLSSGRTTEYNSSVEGFNTLVNRYNSLISSRQSQINEYNRVVELYNSLATTEKELVQSLKADQVKQQDKMTGGGQ